MYLSAVQLKIYLWSSVCRLNEKNTMLLLWLFAGNRQQNNKGKFEVAIGHLGNTVISMNILYSVMTPASHSKLHEANFKTKN